MSEIITKAPIIAFSGSGTTERITENSEPELIVLLIGAIILAFAFFLLLQGSKFYRIAFDEDIMLPTLFTVFSSLLVGSFWFVWKGLNQGVLPAHTSIGFFAAVISEPKPFLPGLFLAAILPTLMATYYFIISASASPIQYEESNAKARSRRFPSIAGACVSIVTFAASLTKLIDFFSDKH